jgi:calcineurin-like phosphoesterase family protein
MKIKLLPDQQIWFTSDTHYAHSNICRATTNWKDADQLTRDFTSLEEMNQTLVDRINQQVMPNDILIHLGDWSFGGFDNIRLFREQLNCKNIILIKQI